MRITHHPILPPLNRKSVQFQFNGITYTAYDGESIAAALLAHGVRTLRYSPKNGEPRGLYCGIGHCYECIVHLENSGDVRACITPVQDKMCLTSKKRGNTYAG
jgi:sarcosine oxidase subunit alpha